MEDAALALEYAKCKEGKSALINLYEGVRRELIDFKAKVEGIIE